MPGRFDTMEVLSMQGRPLLVVFLIVFLDLVGAGILSPVIPYIVAPWRKDGLTVGLLALGFSAGQFLAAPLLGVLSDRFGRRPVLLISLAGTAAGYFLFAWGPSLEVLFLARILDGITGGNISTAQAAIADISSPKDRARNFGLIGAAFGLGFIIGPAMGGALSRISLHAPAFGAGIFSLLTLAATAVLFRETLPAASRSSKIARASMNPLAQVAQGFRRREFSLLLSAVFMLNFGLAALQTNFSVFTRDRFNYSASDNAWILTFLGLTAAVTQGLLLRKLAPLLGESRLAWSGSLIGAAGFVFVAMAAGSTMLYVSILLTALGFGLTGPSLTGLISRRAHAEEQGLWLGTAQAWASMTRILGPLLAGLLYDHLSQPSPYWAGAACSLFAAGLAWFAVRSDSRS
jgi:multidrug resistance protein